MYEKFTKFANYTNKSEMKTISLHWGWMRLKVEFETLNGDACGFALLERQAL